MVYSEFGDVIFFDMGGLHVRPGGHRDGDVFKGREGKGFTVEAPASPGQGF